MQTTPLWRCILALLGATCVAFIGCSASSSPDEEHVGTAAQAAYIAEGSLSRTAIATYASTAKDVDVVAVTGGRLVTAIVSHADTLRLLLWRVSEVDDTLELLSDNYTGLSATQVSVARIDDRRLLAVVRKTDGTLAAASLVFDHTTDAISLVQTRSLGTGTAPTVASMNTMPNVLEAPYESVAAVVSYRKSNSTLALSGLLVLGDGSLALQDTQTLSRLGTTGMVVAAVPGTQPTESWISRRSSTGLTERSNASCMDGLDNDEDKFIDTNDWDCCIDDDLHDGQGSCTWGLVVTAAPDSGGNLVLTSWSVSAFGHLAMLKETVGPPATEMDITSLSFRRIATASTTTGAHPQLATWDVALDGTITSQTQRGAGVLGSNAQVVNGGGGRLFFLFSKSNGEGYLQTTDAFHDLFPMERARIEGTMWANRGQIAPIAGDRVITTRIGNDGLLNVRVYRDFSIPLLRGTYTPSVAIPKPTAPDVSAPPFDYEPSFSPQGDATVAASDEFVVACGNGRSTVYDRRNPGQTFISEFHHNNLFNSVMAGAANEQNINRHLAYQAQCNPAAFSGSNAWRMTCMNETFDTRCAYDTTAKRFVLMSMIRYRFEKSSEDRKSCTKHSQCTSGICSTTCAVRKDYLQRYVALAVSKTEDPRDGFNVFMTADNKFDDNPTMAANLGMITVTHMAPSYDEEASFPDETLRASAFVFDTADLSAASAVDLNQPPNIRSTKIARWQVGDRERIQTAAVYGYMSMGVLTTPISGNYRLYFFGKPGRGEVPVFPGPVSVDTTGVHQQAQPAVVLDRLRFPVVWGHMYFPEVFTPAGGTAPGVQVSGVQIGIEPGKFNNISISGVFSIPAGGCGGLTSYSCAMPAIAAHYEKVGLVYGRYQTNVQKCPAGVVCATGLCSSAGVCNSNPGLQHLRFATFDRELSTRISSGLIETGDYMYLDGDGRAAWRESPSTQSFASVTFEDTGFGDSIFWGLHAVPHTASSGPTHRHVLARFE